MCYTHREGPCDCADFMKVTEWELYDDMRNVIGVVQQFHEEGPYYGNTGYGRTGAVSDRIKCQKMVETMIEEGRSRHDRTN